MQRALIFGMAFSFNFVIVGGRRGIRIREKPSTVTWEGENQPMGYEDYISETEAATIAGVSVNTLSRFAEAGYLQIESDSDGLRMFSKRELGDVFGIRESRLSDQIEVERTPQRSDTTSKKEVNAASPSPEMQTPAVEPTPKSETFARAADEDVTSNGVNGFSPEREAAREESRVSPDPEGAASERPSKPENSRALEMLQEEVTTLKNVVNLQEKLLDIREAELADLQKEREWLRSRIERAEEKADRDQLLLLSETQLLRQMLTEQQRRSSPFRNALEWLGFVQPRIETATAPGGAIDISKRKSA